MFHGLGNPGKHSLTKNAQNAPDRSELRVNTPNTPGARQLHEVTSTVTVNLALVSLKMHEMHEMHQTGLNYALILQMHQVHDSCANLSRQ